MVNGNRNKVELWIGILLLIKVLNSTVSGVV